MIIIETILGVLISIIVFILKFILYVFLGILGLVLLLVLIILFVPISYRVEGGYHEKLAIDVKVAWLFHFIRGGYVQNEKEQYTYVKIFFFTVYKSDVKSEDTELTISNEERKTEMEEEIYEEERHAEERLQENIQKLQIEEKAWKKGEVIQPETDEKEKIKKQENVEQESIEEKYKDAEQESIEEKYKDAEHEVKENREKEELESRERQKKSQEAKVEELRKRKVERQKEQYKKEKEAKKEGQKQNEKKQEQEKEQSQFSKYKNFLFSPENEGLLPFLFTHVKKLIKWFLPKHMKVQFEVGLEDKALTGQIAGIGAMIYPFAKRNFLIIPNFEEEIIAGDFFLKGKLYIFKMVYYIIRVYLDKRVRRCIKFVSNEKSI